MFQLFIFDLDGTLVDSYPGILESLNETLRAIGKPSVDLATVKRMVGRGVENLMQQAAGDRWQEAIKIFRESYDRTHLTGSSLMPEVDSTLEALRAHQVMLAIASNKPPVYTRNIVRYLGISQFFDSISGPGIDIQPKPHPSMLTHIMQHLNATARQTLYVGDMLLDAETARNAGVRVALIPGGGGDLDDLRNAHPDYLLTNFSDLIRLTL